MPREYFTFYNDLNSLGIRELSISFGAKEVPKVDNFTVVIRGIVESDSDRQYKVSHSLKITFKIRQTE